MDSAEAHAHEAHTHAPVLNLNRLAISATTHCLTGCAVGEVMGMIIATALGWSDVGQIALAVGLAYVFGLASLRCSSHSSLRTTTKRPSNLF
jgi:hypothetical protein